jgi:uncharacterized protein
LANGATVNDALCNYKWNGKANYAQGNRVDSSRTLLTYAASKGYTDIIRVLLKYGADIEQIDYMGLTALIWAVDNGHIDTVRFLLANEGVEIGYINYRMVRTALMFAASNGHFDIVKILLDKGAEINAKGYGGETALMYAAEKGHIDIVKALLAKGAEINSKTDEGDTALTLASKNNHPDIVKLLKEAGAKE